MNVLAAVLALQVKQLHHQFIGVAGVNLSLQEDDPVLQQQIPQRQLPLPLIALVGVRVEDRLRKRLAHGAGNPVKRRVSSIIPPGGKSG